MQDDGHEDEDDEDGDDVEGDLEEPDRITEPKPALLETRNTEKNPDLQNSQKIEDI